LDSDLLVLKNSRSLTALLDQLKIQVKDFYVTEEEMRFKNTRSPYFSLLFIIAKQRGVKDWFSGLALSEKTTGKTHALQFHHIMPKSLLKDLGHDHRTINDLANLTFIGGKTNRSISNKLPMQYFVDIINKRGPNVFSDNHIPTEKSLWDIQNYTDFLEFRRKKLVNEINSFISSFERYSKIN
jgi:hypothetical protein